MRNLSVFFTVLFISVYAAEGFPGIQASNSSSKTQPIIGNKKTYLRDQGDPPGAQDKLDKEYNDIPVDRKPAEAKAVYVKFISKTPLNFPNNAGDIKKYEEKKLTPKTLLPKPPNSQNPNDKKLLAEIPPNSGQPSDSDARKKIVRVNSIEDGDGRPSEEDGKKLSREKSPLEIERRPLQTGDIFTSHDLLPVAEKLIEKVNKPGAGTGIVSSAKSSYELADSLYGGYFLGQRRITILRDLHIAGLDALQALALSGDEIPIHAEETREFGTIIRQNDDLQADLSSPGKCKFMLMYKTPETRNKNKRYLKKAKSNSKALLKKQMKRDPARKNYIHTKSRELKHVAKKNGSQNKPNQLDMRLQPNNQKLVSEPGDGGLNPITVKPRTGSLLYTPESSCRWRYFCEEPRWSLEACTVQTYCNRHTRGRKEPPETYISGAMDEKGIKFRQLFKISAVDEEVEKILELHHFRMRMHKPVVVAANIQTLGQYFDVVMKQELKKNESPRTQSIDNYDDGFTERYHIENDLFEVKDVTALGHGPVNQDSVSNGVTGPP